MRKVSIILSFIVIIVFAGCERKKNITLLDVIVDTVKLSSYKESLFKQFPSQFTKSKTYINLEMTKGENYVDEINKISFINGKFYVLDTRKKVLVMYNRDGKFIDQIGQLNKDYINIADFNVDKDGKVCAIDGSQDNLLIFDAHHKLIRRNKLPFEADALQCLDDNNLLFGLSSWNKKSNSGDKVVKTNIDLHVLNNILKYDEYVDNNYWISEYQFIKTDSCIFYNRPIENNVYRFDLNGKLLNAINFDFGKENVPNGDKTNIHKNLPRFDKYRLLTNFTAIGSNYAFGKFWIKRKHTFFFLDKKQKVVYLEDIAKFNELKNVVDFDGKHLISFIYPGEYDPKAESYLSDEAKAHLEKGGIVVCDYLLNDF